MHIEHTAAFKEHQELYVLDCFVAGLNPLRLDKDFLRSLADMSENAAISGLLGAVQVLLTGVRRADAGSKDPYIAMAMTRDLAMLAGMLVRLDVNLSQVPGLEYWLLKLAEGTDEVPTDTIFHYTVRNPPAPLRRMFTTLPEEELFIRALALGMKCLVVAVAGLEVAQDIPMSDPQFAGVVRESSEKLKDMSKAMNAVRDTIPPELFTKRLRPFFEPKVIGGKTYQASNGAQMPLNVVDLILWSIEEEDASYAAYLEHNLSYLPAAYRRRVARTRQKPSLLNRAQHTVRAGVSESNTPGCLDSLSALIELSDVLMRFRGPHLGVAKANLRIRPEGSVGSGGYDDGILRYLIRRTHQVKLVLLSAREQLKR